MDVRFNAISALSPVKKYQNTQKAAQQTAIGVKQAADKVDVSANGKVFAQAMRKLSDTPEVREDRVADLRARIQSGTYNANSRNIAAKMLGLFDAAQ